MYSMRHSKVNGKVIKCLLNCIITVYFYFMSITCSSLIGRPCGKSSSIKSTRQFKSARILLDSKQSYHWLHAHHLIDSSEVDDTQQG